VSVTVPEPMAVGFGCRGEGVGSGCQGLELNEAAGRRMNTHTPETSPVGFVVWGLGVKGLIGLLEGMRRRVRQHRLLLSRGAIILLVLRVVH